MAVHRQKKSNNEGAAPRRCHALRRIRALRARCRNTWPLLFLAAGARRASLLCFARIRSCPLRSCYRAASLPLRLCSNCLRAFHRCAQHRAFALRIFLLARTIERAYRRIAYFARLQRALRIARRGKAT